jgi:hypothetical protein
MTACKITLRTLGTEQTYYVCTVHGHAFAPGVRMAQNDKCPMGHIQRLEARIAQLEKTVKGGK